MFRPAQGKCPHSEDEDRWVREFQSFARRLRANPSWQAHYRHVVERLKNNVQGTLDDELAIARAEDPDRFLVLIKTLTEQRHVNRGDIRSFIESRISGITPPVFRNALRLYCRVFLPRGTGKTGVTNVEHLRGRIDIGHGLSIP